jgi:S-adenosylmethionine synthetase
MINRVYYKILSLEVKTMTLELGGNIQLTGFRDLDPATLIIVKKIVGNFVKHVSSTYSNFKGLNITLKSVHEREKSEKYEIHAHLNTDTTYTAYVVERNLMVGLDSVLKKVEKTMRPRD